MSSIYLERAQYAYDEINKIKKDLEKKQNAETKVPQYAKTIPSYIKTNGLLAAMAFVNVKCNSKLGSSVDVKAYQYLYKITECWCRKTVLEKNRETDFLEILANLPLRQYKQTEREVIALYEWLRRFAESELK